MQLRALFGYVLLSLSAFAPANASTPMPAIVIAAAPAMFDSKAAAQAHCPRDVIVKSLARSETHNYETHHLYKNRLDGILPG
jgi:hypothetical protein